ncbi:hypothetical protein BZY95_03530 [Billgrantia desiderata SP1]|nr:hypothetical protein BZY95_03530 [Halomonas desiderata SP1]
MYDVRGRLAVRPDGIQRSAQVQPVQAEDQVRPGKQVDGVITKAKSRGKRMKGILGRKGSSNLEVTQHCGSEALRQGDTTLPVVAITGYATSKWRMQFLSATPSVS